MGIKIVRSERSQLIDKFINNPIDLINNHFSVPKAIIDHLQSLSRSEIVVLLLILNHTNGEFKKTMILDVKKLNYSNLGVKKMILLK